MKSMIAALAVLACTAGAAFAQDKTSEEVAAAAAAASARATALVEANTRPLAFDGGLSGPGADFLRGQTQKAQFVLLGEGHNDHDTPCSPGRCSTACGTGAPSTPWWSRSTRSLSTR